MMDSVILRVAARWLSPILLILALVVLYRGHNQPGGGFIGGLMAAGGLVLYSIAFGTYAARKYLRIDPQTLLVIGLLLAFSSALPALIVGEPLMTGLWHKPTIPVLGTLPLGTPLLFDIGVFLTVISISLLIIWSLQEDD